MSSTLLLWMPVNHQKSVVPMGHPLLIRSIASHPGPATLVSFEVAPAGRAELAYLWDHQVRAELAKVLGPSGAGGWNASFLCFAWPRCSVTIALRTSFSFAAVGIFEAAGCWLCPIPSGRFLGDGHSC